MTEVKALGFLLITEGVWAGAGGAFLALESESWIPPLISGPGLAGAAAVIAAGAALSFAAYRTLMDVGGGTPLMRWPPHRLVRSGPYGWMRHPQAAGLIIVTVGTAWIVDDPAVWFLPLLAAGYQLVALLPAEARQLAERFGDEYLDYVQTVPGWWPRRPG